jgi:hypothetical protein
MIRPRSTRRASGNPEVLERRATNQEVPLIVTFTFSPNPASRELFSEGLPA